MEYTIIPNQITIVSAQSMRRIAESGCDPDLYDMAARAFDALNMSTAAARLRQKAEHYRNIKNGQQTETKKS